jgi:hypothetical protein
MMGHRGTDLQGQYFLNLFEIQRNVDDHVLVAVGQILDVLGLGDNHLLALC